MHRFFSGTSHLMPEAGNQILEVFTRNGDLFIIMILYGKVIPPASRSFRPAVCFNQPPTIRSNDMNPINTRIWHVHPSCAILVQHLKNLARTTPCCELVRRLRLSRIQNHTLLAVLDWYDVVAVFFVEYVVIYICCFKSKILQKQMWASRFVILYRNSKSCMSKTASYDTVSYVLSTCHAY